ncbi:hypothetical protein ACHQM5_014293 [Ranunculus cassubicifolius]
MGGTNVGASTRIYHRTTTACGESGNGCSVNIYVNSNVQGVNNSIVMGGEVVFRDPGVHLYLGDIYMEKRKQREDSWVGGNVLLMICMIGFVLLSWFLCFKHYKS